MIIPVKKAKIFIMEEDKVDLLVTLQKHNILMASNIDAVNIDTKYEDDVINRAEFVLKELTKYQEKKSMFEYFSVDYDEYIIDDVKRFDLLDSLENDIHRISELKNENTLLEEKIELINPFAPMPYALSDLSKSLYVTFKVGYINEDKKEGLLNYFSENKVEFEIYELSKYGYPLIFVLDKDEEVKSLFEIEGLGFIEAKLPEIDNKARREIEQLQINLDKNNLEIENISKKLADSKEQETEIRILIDQLQSKKERMSVTFGKTSETVYIEGWVREDHTEKLKSIVSLVTNTFDIDYSDPTEEDDAPTAVVNNKFVSQFEVITNMFSPPSQADVDPNPVMSVWYWIIFGIMMGDMGYGLVMVLGIGIFLKLKKSKPHQDKLMRVLYYSGYTSILAGMVYGSFFGFAVNEALGLPSFSIQDKPMEMLYFSVILGAFHLMSGLALKMKVAFKHNDPLTAIADGLSWILILMGGLLFAVPGLVFGVNIQALTYIGLSLVGVGVLLILTLAGREKKGAFSKVTAGLGGIYNVTSYLSDLLSYSRILALALSSGIIAWTMNYLAAMLHGSWYGWIFALVIYVVGHVFNFAMGLLSAYVHDSRLQYIEFFDKFYEGGGTEFTPLSLKTNYINEITY